MAEFDKKFTSHNQKAPTDLVQSVLEAQEKKNLDRVDVLIVAAIKQLKMSRFKPDQATCLSLTYLARISPKTFSQSNAIKEQLRSLVRRDNGPPNIKGKNDILLPVLAANILLACCDSNEIREMILQRIPQWNSPSPSEIVQHLMGTLCLRCQGDSQSIQTLVDMRSHWIQYFEENFESHESVPADLCLEFRSILEGKNGIGYEKYLLACLKFLAKYDPDIESLGEAVSKRLKTNRYFFSCHPSVDEVDQFYQILIKIYVRLITHLLKVPDKPAESCAQVINSESKSEMKKPDLININDPSSATTDQSSNSRESNPTVIVKLETVDTNKQNITKEEVKEETKPNVTSDSIAAQPMILKFDQVKIDTDKQELKPAPSFLYVKPANSSMVIKISTSVVDGMLLLLSAKIGDDETKKELFDCWLIDDAKIKRMANIYEDFALTKLYRFSDNTRRQLINSSNLFLIELALRDACPSQLIKSIHQFGMTQSAIEMILKKLETVEDTELLKSEIPDQSHFNQLMEYYSHTGFSGAQKLNNRLYPTLN